jgi:RimJ/RimL family protein N-acetyltransferase
MCKLREFDEKDASRLVAMFDEAFRDEISRGTPQLTAHQFIDLSKKAGVKIFVCESDESEVVGFLSMTEGSIEHPAQVHLVAVESSFQRRGIGKKLLQKALEHAKAVGRRKVTLFTRPWNIAMRKLCAELGFVPEGYLRRDYLDEDLILYSAFLK